MAILGFGVVVIFLGLLLLAPLSISARNPLISLAYHGAFQTCMFTGFTVLILGSVLVLVR
ncbi:MAG TPA: hypothetical protein VNT75_14065 [Symbiobacteriaceae bacterium]|nr:hypothetical protein [Symbiobacteriaceae bacterium]